MIYDKYALCDEDFGNLYDEKGLAVGFQLKARIPYYRAVRLSLVENITVKVDGKSYPADEIYLTVEDGTFSLKEMKTCYDLYWGFGEKAIITVKHADGLGRAFSTGWRDVEIGVFLRISYARFAFNAITQKKLYTQF
jgi:hypothetical protein